MGDDRPKAFSQKGRSRRIQWVAAASLTAPALLLLLTNMDSLLDSKGHLDYNVYLLIPADAGASSTTGSAMLRQQSAQQDYAAFVRQELRILENNLPSKDGRLASLPQQLLKKRRKEESASPPTTTTRFVMSHKISSSSSRHPYLGTLLGLLSRPTTGNHMLMLEMLLKFSFESKPFSPPQHSGSLTSALHSQTFNQTLSHLSRFVLQGLHRWNAGASTWAIGVMGTWAYISILKLELIMQEYTELNPNVSPLKLTESDKVPLVTKETFDECIKQFKGSQEMMDQWETLRDELYQTKNDGLDENGIPMGVRLLHDLMMSPCLKLFGSDYRTIFRPSGIIIDDLVGSGSFGFVFSLMEDANAVLKVSQTVNTAHLEKEEIILRHLGRHEGSDTIIINNDDLALPVLMQVKNDFAYELGGCQFGMKALILRPKGRPIRSLTGVSGFECFLGYVCVQLKRALDFIHSKNVVHNDVTPKNIVVNSATWKVCLIDFGCATNLQDKIQGFVGTSLYAHPTIFEKYPDHKWTALPAYDFFSLGLTMSALFNEGEPCWDMNPFPITLNDDNRDDFLLAVKNRFMRAVATIENSFLPSLQDKQEWIQWISTEDFPDDASMSSNSSS